MMAYTALNGAQIKANSPSELSMDRIYVIFVPNCFLRPAYSYFDVDVVVLLIYIISNTDMGQLYTTNSLVAFKRENSHNVAVGHCHH